MITFALCCIPGAIIAFGLWLAGIAPEWGILAIVISGLVGYSQAMRR